ncbi:protein FAR1-RELATED SEQUENCE 9-like isoform X3 [Panicum virgatum]|uniref:protein FAR1-RELATED SEQUENCE 9-like isoform X3 n=1 Tax=Panicum virgatum TaxID=38727 RepID=UPI0019D61423|nr:protein FAR1-RELATED SEQUENCE 9-like isoform X3 [Panicum virgatum]
MSRTGREPLSLEGGFGTAAVHGGAEASFSLWDGSIGSELAAPPVLGVDQGGTCLLPSSVRGSDQIASFLQSGRLDDTNAWIDGMFASADRNNCMPSIVGLPDLNISYSRLGDGHSIPTDIAQVIKKLDFNNGDDDDNFVFNCAASEAGTLNDNYSGIESFSIKLGEATMEDIGLQPAAVCRWGTKRCSLKKRKKNGADTDRYQLGQDFYCSCRDNPGANVKTSSSKTNCKAMLHLHRTSDDAWVVVEHISEHNHPLSETYREKKHWPSHHHLDKYTKDLIRLLRNNNIGITKLYTILGDFLGSMQNVPATKICLKLFCQKINREQAEDDIKKTLALVRELCKSDPGFMFSVDTDDDGRIKTFMWTNSHSRMQYDHFGDVVSFDTTFQTDLYDMPFGLFVGVNNHFQTVLLGGVLMTDEKIESFRWVFKEFASMMGGKEPKTILTDQCRAMEVAIAEEWKNTIHQWCKWPVLKRVKECVRTKYTSIKEFRDKFHFMLNEMLTIEEFENSWATLWKQYGLQDNDFLKQIYETREKWVKSYFKGVFYAGMTSTQRSESANHMLKNILSPGRTLHKFIDQYMKLQYIRDEDENYEERRNKLNSKRVTTGGPLVVHAHKIYTLKVFALFCELKEDSELYRTVELIQGQQYLVEHYNLDRVQHWCKGRYTIDIVDNGRKYSCECGLFEHFGLPCSHVLRVMISCGAQQLPECMVVQRWTKKARHVLPEELSQYKKDNLALLAQTYRHSSLLLKALQFIEMGDSNAESHTVAMKVLDDGIESLTEISKQKDGMGLGHTQTKNQYT